MPCTKCDNGKWKWGENGECKYTSKDACEKANPKHYENLKNTKIVELLISSESEELTIDAISLVTNPAIEENFVFFGKEKNNLTFAKIDEEKRMLVSPALIPNKQIFRHDPNTDSDYYVYFSKDTVQRASELYLEYNNHHKATYEHQDRVSGVLTVESWIIENTKTDKSTLYGFSLPVGTWMVKLKISNDEIWEKIKDGELKGLSIEGYFTNKFEQMQKKQPTDHEILSALNELFKEGKLENLKLSKKLSLAKRIELKDIKTLEKLTGQLKSATDKLDASKIKSELSNYNKENAVVKKEGALLDTAEDYISITKKRIEKAKTELEADEKAYLKVEKKYDTAKKKTENAANKVFSANDKYMANWKKGESISTKLEEAIFLVDRAAKDLGVKISVSQYEAQIDKFYNNEKDPLSKLDMDY